MDIEAKISALNIVVEQMREKIDPVTDFSKMTLEEIQEYKCKEIQDEISHFIERMWSFLTARNIFLCPLWTS